MTLYWVIAPCENKPDLLEKVWKYDLENKVISIGWTDLGDVSRLDEPTLEERIKETYPDANPGHIFRTFRNFYHHIKKGDIVIARKGRKTILAVGTVSQTAFYDESKGKELVENLPDYDDYRLNNFIGVEWHDSPRDKEFEKVVFPMNTLCNILEEKYKSLVAGEGPERPEPVEEPERPEFPLEKYLEEFIVSNFDKIFKGRLMLYDEEGVVAQQYSTDVGDIDILAKETSSDSYVVIELKRGQESDKVVGQTLRYMGWVKENLCKDNQEVKGIIICREANDRLLYAIKMVNNIDLKYYRVNFELLDRC